MKIAILNYYQNSVSRGLETFVNELSTRLAKNHELFIPTSPATTHTTSTELSFLRRFFLNRPNLEVAFWSLKNIFPLFHFQSQVIFALNGGWQAFFIAILSRLTGSKLVIVGQSGPGWDDRWNLFIKPDLFVALTQKQLDWARKATIWNQNFALIPNGVDLDLFKPIGPKAKIDLTKPIILCVAAASPAKRVEETIKAVAKLKKASLLLVGTGPLNDQVNKTAQKLLGKNFLHFSLTHQEMPPVYRSADLFTLCSDSSEAFGIVYLEAMATGLGVVATDDQSRREIVGKAGLFVKDPTNQDEYAHVLEAALSKRWKSKAQAQAARFSWEKVAVAYETELAKI